MGCIGFLVYRFNAVFNVSKTRALVVAILCALGSIPFFAMGDVFNMIAFTCLCYSFIYGCIWFFKYNRDKQIVERAKATKTQPRPVHMEQPMNNQGSRRLFVPPPIDRQP